MPYWCVLVADCVIITIAGLISTYVCMGGSGLASHFWHYVRAWIVVLPFFIVGMRLMHTYSSVLRYSGVYDLKRVVIANAIGIVCVFLLRFILPEGMIISSMQLKVIGLTFLLATGGHWGLRIIMRLLYDSLTRSSRRRRVFIYGVYEGGVAIAKAINEKKDAGLVVAGFVSPDGALGSKWLMGAKVYRDGEHLIQHMKESHAKTLMVSPLQVEHFRERNDLIKELIANHIKIMILPAEAEEWKSGESISYSQLHEVDIEDLLPRDKITVDLNAIGNMLEGKRILITGAAGSIGSEMARQVAKFMPKELVLLDQAETPMHDVRLYMKNNHPDMTCFTIVGSITNQTQMENIFRDHRPEYVFHAAAYKHVPMMEDNPAMAIQNNTYGTRVIADLAVKYGTRKFVMISTDKAVNPTNVMGCSKRICEIYCQSLNKALKDKHDGKHLDKAISKMLTQADGTEPVTQFITTRFGNVLGSNGSVIPIFKEQIRKGGPVTVTHPDIIRFFMLIPEACQLVLEAGTMGKGGEIFVFDMGKPVRIADLAQRMIDLSGAKGVEIKFTGLRDGEKLYEEVLNDAEQTKPTMHPKIKIAAVREYDYSQALTDEKELYDLSFTYDDMAIVKKMKQIVPEYKSQHSKYEALDK